MSAEVGLLTRNIRIQGDESSESSFFGVSYHFVINNIYNIIVLIDISYLYYTLVNKRFTN